MTRIQYNDDGTALVPLTMPFVCTFGPIEPDPKAEGKR